MASLKLLFYLIYLCSMIICEFVEESGLNFTVTEKPESNAQVSNRFIFCLVANVKNIAFPPSALDFSKCSHVLYGHFLIDENTLDIIPNYRTEATDSYWFLRMVELKLGYPHVKLFLHLEDIITLPKVINHQINKHTFIGKLHRLMMEQGFEGVFLNWEWPQKEHKETYGNFLCELKSVLGKSDMEIGVWLPGNILLLNYDAEKLKACVDFFPVFTGSNLNLGLTQYAFPLFIKNESLVSVEYSYYGIYKKLPVEKVLLFVDSSINFYKLKSPKNVSELSVKEILKCCGLLVEAEIDKYNNKFANAWMCEKIAVGLGWRFIRELPGNEAFATNGTHWVTYEDVPSLSKKMEFVLQKSLGGVVIWSTVQDYRLGASCASEIEGKRYPLLRTINSMLSFNSSALNTKQDKTRQRKIDLNCPVVKDLKSAGLNLTDASIWSCVLQEERNISSFSTIGVSFKDGSNCSTRKFGPVGIYEPICRMRKTTCGLTNHCGEICEELVTASIEKSIQCFKKNKALLPSSWEFCKYRAAQGNLTQQFENCENFGMEEFLQSENNAVVATVFLGLGVFATLIAIVVVVLMFLRKRKFQRNSPFTREDLREFAEGAAHDTLLNPSSQSCKELEDFARHPYDDRFEVKKGDVTFSETLLGSGVFGVVTKGMYKGIDVAIKTLNPSCPKAYFTTILEEIKIYAYLGIHENVVEFVGANTKQLNKGKILFLMEFCSFGSLDTYLRKNRPQFEQSNGKISSFSFKLLQKFCIDIASGMNFLEMRKVIHGDLSAKNILLDANATAKVADFGLSRKLYIYTDYVKKSQVPLPWRWMSIEALKEMRFSSKSDVWAFGITMWEIFSLGAVPYPGYVYSTEFLEALESEGFRPQKPAHSSNFIYEFIMKPMWNASPQQRPTFEVMKNLLQNQLDREITFNFNC